MPSTINFYSELPYIQNLDEISDNSKFGELPEDWVIIITDIKGSTTAIENGKYREVNMIGAAVIAAVKNCLDSYEFPFVFGGDGATLIVHKNSLDDVLSVLYGLKDHSSEVYGLELRVGYIHYEEVLKAGSIVKVSKIKYSDFFFQAVFKGGGLEIAEKLIKSNSLIMSRLERPSTANLTGLECRWEDVKPPKGEICALLVKVVSTTLSEGEVYGKVLLFLEELENNQGEFHPIADAKLKLTLSLNRYINETKARVMPPTLLKKIVYFLNLIFAVIAGKFLMALNISTNETNWGEYKKYLQINTDYQKFDEMLRMVINLKTESRIKLESFLDLLYKQGHIVYGIHVSEKALLTCLVSKYEKDHIHFVDAAGGGYALAASKMKAQIKTIDVKPVS